MPIQVQRIVNSGYIDLTDATSDYYLKAGEKAIIRAVNTTFKPLRIATHSETYYRLDILPLNTGGTSGGTSAPVYLYPNNTTYSNAFVFAEMYRNESVFSHSYVTYSAFRIGWAWPHSVCWIANTTQNKSVVGMSNLHGGLEWWPNIVVYATSWRDTTTSWTSLGTIVWPQNSSAIIIVERLY